ncbi:hypothetical protein F511_26747 [Dorcoceras hygrometricum]|uniref:Uncharacterized protein n=1 Tax=Dorcoceras hygrometricum TaxID=472368 RepID=A0A2Z7C3I5_9LAMI|nr:hypothetical protein F511_26747 [Dorcoceras hygrometricum]
MTFRVVRTNQYNQDLGLIHSTNDNHLESPKEGSSIDHQVLSLYRLGLRCGTCSSELRFEGIGFSIGDFWIFIFEVEKIRCGLLVAIGWLGTDPSGARGFGKIVFRYEILCVSRWIDEFFGNGCLEDIRFEVYRFEKLHERLLFIEPYFFRLPSINAAVWSKIGGVELVFLRSFNWYSLET